MMTPPPPVDSPIIAAQVQTQLPKETASWSTLHCVFPGLIYGFWLLPDLIYAFGYIDTPPKVTIQPFSQPI